MNFYMILSPFKDANGMHKPGDADVSLSSQDATELLEINAVQLSTAAQPVVPVDPHARQTDIISAIQNLDVSNLDLWLQDGRPDIAAITDLTGWPITAGERNAAWKTIKG